MRFEILSLTKLWIPKNTLGVDIAGANDQQEANWLFWYLVNDGLGPPQVIKSATTGCFAGTLFCRSKRHLN